MSKPINRIYFIASQSVNVPDRIVSAPQLVTLLADDRVHVIHKNDQTTAKLTPQWGHALYCVANVPIDPIHHTELKVERIAENFDSSG